MDKGAEVMGVIFDANLTRGQLADFITDGVSDHRVTDLLKRDDQFLPIECELLDYKESFVADALSLAKLSRHILALYNTFGGYLIFGVKEEVAEVQFELVGCLAANFDLKQIKDKLYSYLGVHIPITSWNVDYGGDRVIVGIFVPKRYEPVPLFFGKEGPQDGKNFVFRKGDAYIRRGDNSEPAVGPSMAFLFGERFCYYTARSTENLRIQNTALDHNLPDRNFICPKFIGRKNIIDRLWLWFADEFSYVRVLAGEGGLGKTSIAYEFALQLCAHPPTGIERLLWVTAKKRQFSGPGDDYIPVPETHFASYTTLLQRLCIESAVSNSEIDGADDVLLKRFLKEALLILPTIVIVDDVDSLSAMDQKRVLELAMQLSTTKSRFLLTTRKNMTYSPDIALEIKGLAEEDYSAYVDVLRERFDGPTVKPADVENMRKVTHGSPLFTDSLYRLIRRGYTVKRAADDWRGKKGAEARKAALLVEIQSLSEESKRVLLAVSILKSCSLTELIQTCKYTDETLDECIEELSAVYLISAPRIVNEPRYEVEETMYNLVLQIKDELVPGASKFEEEVLKSRKVGVASKGVNTTSLVGKAIFEASAFLREGDVNKALETVAAAQRRSKYHPDLYLMQGKCLMAAPVPKPIDARHAFGKAYAGGVRKSLLFDLWYQAELDSNHPVGAVTVSDLALGERVRADGYWELRKVRAMAFVAASQERSGDLDAAIKSLMHAAEINFKSISDLPPQEQFPAREILFALNDSVLRLSKLLHLSVVNSIDTVDRIILMISRSDYRRLTLVSLVEYLSRARKAPSMQNRKLSADAIDIIRQAKIDVIKALNDAKKSRRDDEEFIATLIGEASK